MSVWLLICAFTGSWAGVSVSVERGPRAGAFSCFNNNILRIDCWWAGIDPAEDSGSWLLFTNNHRPASRYQCIFRAGFCSVELPPEEVLVPSDSFSVTLHHLVSEEEQVTLLFPQYLPRKHVKLDPPSDLQSNVSSGHCVLTWAINPALEPFRPLLSYELAFKRQEEAWERARHRDGIVGVSRLVLEAIELKAGSTYEARLRVQMATEEAGVEEEEHYEGPWSPLTPPLVRPHSNLVAVFILLLFISLTYLLFKLRPRVKRTFEQKVPSPAAFFQSLYSVHNGNFRTWAGAHRGARASITSGASAPSTQEAIAVLTWEPAPPWRPLGTEVSRSAGPLEETLLGGHAGADPPLAYLPQEDWVPGSAASPASVETGASSGDYCALGCYSRGAPSTLQSSVPALAGVWALPGDQPSWGAQQECPWVGASHEPRRVPENLHDEGGGIFLQPLADIRIPCTESSEVLNSGERTKSPRADP